MHRGTRLQSSRGVHHPEGSLNQQRKGNPCFHAACHAFMSSTLECVRPHRLSYTSPALSTMEYYKRWRAEGGFVNGRRDVCASSQIRGRWDLCRCTPTQQLPPLTHTPPPPSLPLPVTIPLSRWMGVSKISALSPYRGRTKSSSFLCLFKTWKHVSPIWWSCMILF